MKGKSMTWSKERSEVWGSAGIRLGGGGGGERCMRCVWIGRYVLRDIE